MWLEHGGEWARQLVAHVVLTADSVGHVAIFLEGCVGLDERRRTGWWRTEKSRKITIFK
jgi:hypothetical protein